MEKCQVFRIFCLIVDGDVGYIFCFFFLFFFLFFFFFFFFFFLFPLLEPNLRKILENICFHEFFIFFWSFLNDKEKKKIGSKVSECLLSLRFPLP